MNKGQFRGLLNRTFIEMKTLTATKGEDYARSDDQLANFKRSAAEAGVTPEQVWLIFFNKHKDAIVSHVKACGENNLTYNPSEPIEGRIDDAILYLCLLKGLVQERAGLQEQAGLVADRPSRTRSETRGLEREFCPGFKSGDKREGLLDRSEVLQGDTKDTRVDPPLHDGATGVAGYPGGEGSGEILSAGGIAFDGVIARVLSTERVERPSYGGGAEKRDEFRESD